MAMNIIDDGYSSSQTTTTQATAATVDNSKPQVSFILTMFNILCSAIGIGVLFLPSTLCGAGIYVGVAGILLIGLAADWSSRALVEATCKSQSKSLDDMFRTVLGNWAGHLYSFSVFFMLIGAMSVFTLLMGIQANDFYKGAFAKEQDLANFRIMSVTFSLICGCSLLLKDLKALSYVSIIKIGVILFIFIVALCFARNEYDTRRTLHVPGKVGSFTSEFPVHPTLLGFMKAMGSWQTAYLFHMGVSDMYFSMERRSYSRWSKVSKISVFIIAMLNVGFAVVGYLATADQLIQIDQQAKYDLCSSSGVFLSLYQVKSTFGKIMINTARCLIVFILMSSYPLIFYFLKEYTLLIIKNLFPIFYASKPKNILNYVTIFGVWALVLCCSVITEDPFTIINLMVSVVGTISVFLMPVLAWIQINGGLIYVFSCGLYGQAKDIENNIKHTIRDGNVNTTTSATKRQDEGSNGGKASILGMLAAQSVFWLSCAFIIIGVIISSMEMYQKAVAGQGISWRQTTFPLPSSKQ